MAEGPSVATANSDPRRHRERHRVLGTPQFWIQLHTAAPGAAGTTAIAGNATRKQVTFGAAAAGLKSNDTAISWTGAEVDSTEDYTHWTAWTLAAAGTFIMSGADDGQRRRHRRHVHHPDRRPGSDRRHRRQLNRSP